MAEERKEGFMADELLEQVVSGNLPSTAVKIEGLKKSYGNRLVLKGISLEVNRGEVFGFLGRNGVGKSTTIDCLVGLKEYQEGSIEIYGLDIKKYPLEVKSLYGYSPSEPLTYELMSGYEFLQFVASSFDMDQVSFDSNLTFLESHFGLSEEDLGRRIEEYSHGMKQKVCLMASLIHNPSLWILDEPTVGLDVMVYETLTKMMREYANNGNAIFLTSHNIDLIQDVCDRVAIVNDGVIATLIDFKKEPLKRKDLKRIFFRAYGYEL